METKTVKFNGADVQVHNYGGSEFWANIKMEVVNDYLKKIGKPASKSRKFSYTLYVNENEMCIHIRKDVCIFYGKILVEKY